MIQFAEECAPLVLLSKASLETGLTERQIRDSGIKLRRFGTADYIRPTELNAWILKDPQEENQS